MVRAFTREGVSLETVERIVRQAQRAPSAGFSQGVSFVLVTESAMRKRLAEVAGEEEYAAAGFQAFISTAPVQVVICTTENVYHERYQQEDKLDEAGEEIEWPVPYWHTDAGCALMLLLLSAVNEGLQTAFVGFPALARVRDVLGIPESVTPIGVALIGHGTTDVPSPSLKRGRHELSQVPHRERW